MNNSRNSLYVLLFALLWSLLSGCQPGPTAVVPPTAGKTATAPAASTATVEPSATPAPPTETPLPTSEPTSAPLSAEGPWLVYLHSAPPSMMSPEPEYEEFAIIKQDGSGRTLFQLPQCYNNVGSFLLDGENTDNFTAKIKRGYYVFRPSQATGMMVFRNQGISACNTFLGGNEQDGMLASLYRLADDAIPELLLYKFPDGKVHDRLPLVKCTEQAKDCQDDPSYWGFVSEQEPRWSPNGRYLAFAAIWDAISSDLYLYDRQEGTLRQLTSGPDWVGTLNWSPDGTQIIMQEIPNNGASSSNEPSVWSVSVSSSAIKMLYPIETYNHHILSWLDDTRYLAYDGDLFGPGSGDAGAVGYNLRFVDTVSGENRILFNGSFVTWSFDKVHETIAIYALESSKYTQGTYLVSIEKSNVIPVDVYDYYGWDEKTGLFVSEQECENGLQSYRAFDYLGKFSCAPQTTNPSTPAPTQPTHFPSPDGKAVISVKDGLWLETEGQPAIQISPDEAVDVIWCPDSSCVFYSVRQESGYNLYRVSLPDLVIQLIDEGIQISGVYQWLGGK